MLDVARHFMPKDGVLRYARPAGRAQAQRASISTSPTTRAGAWRSSRYPQLTEVGAWRDAHQARPPRLAAVGRAAARRLLHPGRHPRDRRVRRRAAHHRRPRDRHPGPLAGRHRRLSGAGQHRRRRHRPPSASGTPGASTRTYSPPPTARLRFYENVLDEVLELFPPARSSTSAATSAPRTSGRRRPPPRPASGSWAWRDEDELQCWFIRHFDRWLAERGRRLIGWDEILEGGPGADGAAVSSWRGYAGGIAAARGRATTSSCAPSSRCTWTTGRRPATTSRCPSDTSAPWRTSTASSPCRRSSPRRGRRTRPRHAGQRLDRGDGGPAAGRLPGLPPARRLRRGRLVRAAGARRNGTSRTSRRRMEAHYARLDALGVDYRPPSRPAALAAPPRRSRTPDRGAAPDRVSRRQVPARSGGPGTVEPTQSRKSHKGR